MIKSFKLKTAVLALALGIVSGSGVAWGAFLGEGVKVGVGDIIYNANARTCVRITGFRENPDPQRRQAEFQIGVQCPQGGPNSTKFVLIWFFLTPIIISREDWTASNSSQKQAGVKNSIVTMANDSLSEEEVKEIVDYVDELVKDPASSSKEKLEGLQKKYKMK